MAKSEPPPRMVPLNIVDRSKPAVEDGDFEVTITHEDPPDREVFAHLVELAHHACRSLDYPVALQNAITAAEKELAKWPK